MLVGVGLQEPLNDDIEYLDQWEATCKHQIHHSKVQSPFIKKRPAFADLTTSHAVKLLAYQEGRPSSDQSPLLCHRSLSLRTHDSAHFLVFLFQWCDPVEQFPIPTNSDEPLPILVCPRPRSPDGSDHRVVIRLHVQKSPTKAVCCLEVV